MTSSPGDSGDRPGSGGIEPSVIRIGLPPALGGPDVDAVLDAIGETAAVRFVGGCVRDAVLGRPIRDVDLATPLHPESVLVAAEAAGLRAIPTGLAHGTVTIVAGGRPFEVTTLRRDVETDGRHALVAFTTDWRADAARRDFTMNALSADRDGAVFDYFGGIEDARAGRIVFVGDADRRIIEDVLRLLRFFRFFAHYGAAPADPATVAACARHAAALGILSAERVREELLKLLAAPDPVPAWHLMVEAAVATEILGGTGDVDRLARVVAAERRAGQPAEPLRRLAALIDGTATAAHLAGRWRLSGREGNRLVEALRHRGALGSGTDRQALRRLVHALGTEAVIDQAVFAAADDDRAPLGDWLAVIAGWRPMALPVSGRDVLDLGIAPGEAVGALLRGVEAWWIAHDFQPDRDACLAELRRRVERPG